MADRSSDDPVPIQEPDWKALREIACDAVAAQFPRADRSWVEDAAHECLILVSRWRERETVRDLQALTRKIARAVAVDAHRRNQRELERNRRWSEDRGAGPDGTAHPADGFEPEADPELLWFLVLEYFRLNQSACRDLALLYVKLGNWRDVASAAGTTYEAVRQQWSRCRRAFVGALRRDPGPFREWLDDA